MVGVTACGIQGDMDNADLEKLKISPGKLVPKFKPSVIEYSVTVGSDVKEVKFSPLTSDGGASYVIKGADSSKAVQLTEGKISEAEIVVTAEDGKTTKTYVIRIRRLSANDATLSQLEVSAGVLQPVFSPLTTTYECYLPSSIDNLSIRAKTEDAAMKLSMRDGSPVGTVPLNPGHTLVELSVTSVNGTSTSIYKITAVKSQLPHTLKLKTRNVVVECAVCCGVAHCPSRIKDGPYIYCQSCLDELTRTSKMDPFTGRILGDEEWMVADYKCSSELAQQVAVCSTHTGTIETTLQQMGTKLLAERLKVTQTEEPTKACPDCSKKVPVEDMPLHKEILCTAHQAISLPKHEVKAKPWEKRLVDESCGTEVQSLLKKAKEWEGKYLSALPKPWESPHYHEGKAPLDFLQKVAQCYGTALKCAPRDVQGHVGLGLVMEEFFYAEDLLGLKREVQEDETEGEAERSSKEEEFLAICQLHGVGASASLALQLKAVEAEYHSLKEAGQTHKADHVQQLYAWKSKKALQASQGSYSVDTESPLYRAKLKMQDATSINQSDPIACYHMGRICLLLGEKDTAQQYLSAAVAMKPALSPARFCLGQALPTATGKHAKTLLLHGLSQYLTKLQEYHETKPMAVVVDDLHSQSFYRSTNTLLMDGFLQLAELGGCGFLSDVDCLLCVTPCVADAHLQHREGTYKKLLWSSLKARFMLLKLLHKQNDPAVLSQCRQLSGLLANSGLGSTPELRELQMEVFQLGVVLQPSSSNALCHLGNGQLMQYDATSEQVWVKEAELSFRACIAMEGKPASPSTIPDHLKEQDWWKKRSTPEAKKPTPTGQKAPQAAASSKQPANKQPAKPTAQATTKTQPPARQSGGTRATGAAAAKRPTGGPAPKQPAGPSRQSGPAKPGQQPRQPVQQTRQPGGAAKTGKGVATLGDLKAGTRKPPQPATGSSQTPKEIQKPSEVPQPSQTETTPASKAEINKKTYHPRLGLARSLAKNTETDKRKESHSLYQEVITMAPEVHDAYIELGEMLSKTDPVAAVDVYSRFPFSDPPSFDDAFLLGEIIRLLMASESYDDPRLRSSLIAMGKALGIAVLEKQVSILENKFKTGLLKQVYAGVHGKPVDDPELQAFFKFKCWI